MPGLETIHFQHAPFVEKPFGCCDEVIGVVICENFTYHNIDFNVNSIQHLSHYFEQHQLPNNVRNSVGN